MKGKVSTNGSIISQQKSSGPSIPQHQSFNDGKTSNNFVPSSNLSTFLLSKGSSGSLGTFDNEYSYRINLEHISGGNNNPTIQMMNQQFSMQ